MRVLVMALIALSGIAESLGASATQSRELLEQLRAQRQQILKEASNIHNEPNRVDLANVLGTSRAEIAAILGAPDFCGQATPRCMTASRWTYFFFRYRPPSSRLVSPGTVAVTVTAGGGWSMDLSFSKKGEVQQAKWVKEE